MQKNDFLKYIDEPYLMDKNTLFALNKIMRSFPYFQSVYPLFLKNLHRENNLRFNTELSQNIIYIGDREVLYNFINNNDAKKHQEIRKEEVRRIEPISVIVEEKKEFKRVEPTIVNVEERKEIRRIEPISVVVEEQRELKKIGPIAVNVEKEERKEVVKIEDKPDKSIITIITDKKDNKQNDVIENTIADEVLERIQKIKEKHIISSEARGKKNVENKEVKVKKIKEDKEVKVKKKKTTAAIEID